MNVRVVHYFDYKSPYAYLAQAATDELAARYDIAIERIPYTLNIPDFLGAAELDAEGRDTLETRSAHQWRRVRYSYMDCRREANRRGLTIRGPRKIWNSHLAHVGFLYAQMRGDFQRYHATVYEQFWKRALDIENIEVICAVLAESGLQISDFSEFAAGPGRTRLDDLHQAAESAGVFGVPSWTVDGELFWGSERLERIDEVLRHRR